MMRRFEIHRNAEDADVIGSGVVAEGVAFQNGLGEVGPVAVKWPCGPTLVIPERGIESLVNSHGGRADIVWLDEVTHA